MNILIWAPFGAGTHYWGPGTSAFRLYSENKNKNIKITLVHGSDFQEDFPNVFSDQIQLGHIDNKNLINQIAFLFKSYFWILRNHKKYDVFHGITAFFYTFLPAVWFQKRGKPAFIKISGIQGGFENNGILSKITGFKYYRRRKANFISGYISISEEITKSLIRNLVNPELIQEIPNGVNEKRFLTKNRSEKRALRKNTDFDSDFIVCYIGGLTTNKNIFEIVKAVHILSKKNIDICFLIVGPDRSGGVIRNDISKYIDTNKVNHLFHLIDHTDQPEFYYSISDVFVLNSKFEGLSNSLLEAMACGLPCVVHPASGTNDLIEETVNGFFTNGSAEEIAEKLELIYNDEKLWNYFAENNRRKIEEGYSNTFILKKHIEMFNTQATKNLK